MLIPLLLRSLSAQVGAPGLAQISGRTTVTWEEKFRLAVQYADHVTLPMDVRILRETVFKRLRRDSVGPDGDLDVPLSPEVRRAESVPPATEVSCPRRIRTDRVTTEPT